MHSNEKTRKVTTNDSQKTQTAMETRKKRFDAGVQIFEKWLKVIEGPRVIECKVIVTIISMCSVISKK